MANLLDDLLQKAVNEGLLKKDKKNELSMAKKKEDYFYISLEKRMESKAIIMLVHITECECCGREFEVPNNPLVLMENQKGDKHYKSTITQDEYDCLKILFEEKRYTVKTCNYCIEDRNWRTPSCSIEHDNLPEGKDEDEKDLDLLDDLFAGLDDLDNLKEDISDE